METTTEIIPANMVQYRACLDLILGSAIRGEKFNIDMAFKIIDAVNLVSSEAYARGYESARDIYKSY
jgi:hypothetical protein